MTSEKLIIGDDRCENEVDTFFNCFDDRNYFLPIIFHQIEFHTTKQYIKLVTRYIEWYQTRTLLFWNWV